MPRGVAWDADPKTYTPIAFRSRDVARTRTLCIELGLAISVGHEAQAQLDAGVAVQQEVMAQKMERKRERRASRSTASRKTQYQDVRVKQ